MANHQNSDSPPLERTSSSTGLKTLSGASMLMALLQSICTAVLALSGIRVAIGLSALAAAGGIYAPARGFHQDAIRIPMLTLAAVGALVNLAVLAWIWHLRSRPSAQWRRRELSAKQKRSEQLQVILAVVTLILVGLEVWTHGMVHRKGPPPTQPAASLHRHFDLPAWPGIPSPNEDPFGEQQLGAIWTAPGLLHRQLLSLHQHGVEGRVGV